MYHSLTSFLLLGIQVTFQSFAIIYCIKGSKYPWTYITLYMCIYVCVCLICMSGVCVRNGEDLGAEGQDQRICTFWNTENVCSLLEMHAGCSLVKPSDWWEKKQIRDTIILIHALCFSSYNNPVRCGGKSFLYFVQESGAQQGASNPIVTQ